MAQCINGKSSNADTVLDAHMVTSEWNITLNTSNS